MTTPTSRTRVVIARVAALLGVVSALWLVAGLVAWVPLVFSLPGESHVRVHAAITVASLLVAAWGYWDE